MKGDKEFVRLLNNSNDVVRMVASKLYKDGYNVRILPSLISPDAESRWDYVDDGDMEIIQRIEVKYKPEIDFKSIDDFPYEDIIIDEAYKVDKKYTSTLFTYIIVNKSKTGYLIIPIWTKQHWFKETKFDRREKENREFYLINKKYVRYMEL